MGKTLGGMAEGLGKLAVGVAGGGAALVGKLAIGGTAARMANNTWLNEKVAGGGIKGFIAGGVQSRLSGVADYHFDTRAGLGLGIKGDKGYKTMIKDMTKEQEDAQKNIAAKPKDTKPAKEYLDRAEATAYQEHGEYGEVYMTHYEDLKALNGMIKNPAFKGYDRPRQERLIKERDDAQKELNKVKSAINSDEAFEIQKKILRAQEDGLKLMKEQKKSREEIVAMEAAMRQGRATREAESGFGMNVAQTMSIPLNEIERKEYIKNITEQTKTVSGAIATALGAAATVGTFGLGRFSAKQYVGDQKKIANKLRDVMKEGEKKKNQEKIKDIIAGLDEGAGEDAAGGAKTPPAPAPGGGGTPVI